MKIVYNQIGGLFLLAAMTLGFSGCASHRGGRHIAVEPEEKVLTLDSARQAELAVTFRVPDHYFSKRSRLFISPALYSGDSLVESYPQVVLDAPVFTKKSRRAAVLEKRIDPLALASQKVDNRDEQVIPYRQLVTLPRGSMVVKLLPVCRPTVVAFVPVSIRSIWPDSPIP